MYLVIGMTTKQKIDIRTIGIPKKKETISGVFNAVFGSHAWANLNIEANAFGTLPSYPWDARKELYSHTAEALSYEEEEV